MDKRISLTVRWSRTSFKKSWQLSCSIRSLQQAKNHNGASDVSLFCASSPQIILGRVPWLSNLPNNRNMDFASENRPSSIRLLQKIRLSLPQSRNQGYPAMTLLSLPRSTRNVSRLLYTASEKAIPFTKYFDSDAMGCVFQSMVESGVSRTAASRTTFSPPRQDSLKYPGLKRSDSASSPRWTSRERWVM